MKIALNKSLNLDGKEIDEIELKLEDLTGEDILKVDTELRVNGSAYGFNNVYDQKVLLSVASKASGIIVDDLKKLSAPDFLEVTFSVRNFLMGLSGQKEESKSSEESSSN
ncbi:hypothetical protein N4T77_02665 [Clostridium sp. CX1]|uniref:hypothetical protein n=1 Tax=Clostridium sp. CX1 TaxID=2978346 RepID=UPI0021C22E38|nr:hypothetical protein [Clostridium sp. CX1]MCT8975493.1 hypothetical protein [Clostridium sp. CX1]